MPTAASEVTEAVAALLDIGHMDLDGGRPDRAQAIAQRVPGMQEARGIEQDAVDIGAIGLVDRRDRLALGVGVEDVQGHVELAGLAAHDGIQFLGRGRPIELGLAAPQIFHVGALDQQQLH